MPTHTPKVLISDKLSPTAVQVFKDRGLDVDLKPGLEPAELAKIIGDYDGLAIRSATKVTADLLSKAPNLKAVGRAGIGVDNVDVNAATAAGVVVMNTPFGNAITTAEHAIAMMFALARQIPAADLSTQAGKWEKSKFMGMELTGKTLGIIGCGNIGAIVADKALGIRMKVMAYDPFLSPERALDLGVEKAELDDLFARADIVSLHTPLTDQTRGIIDAKAISKMKPGVRIINCARGGLVIEEDLKAGLESGHVAGTAVDVFSSEPATENILFGVPGVIATPHLGASTSEAQEKVAVQIAEQISDYLLTGAVVNALNMPSVSAEEAPRLRPYMQLAEQLGSFAGQLTNSSLKAIRIEYQGQVTELNRNPIKAVLLQGLLAPLLDSVNMVNAPVIARERNIEIEEITRETSKGYQTLIRLTVETEQQTRSVAGTLFGEDKPRIVEIKGIPIEAELGPQMLYISNSDVPGIIGFLGTTLGEAGVNIATFHLGRAGEGGDAIALIEVDGDMNGGVLDSIKAHEGIRQAELLHF